MVERRHASHQEPRSVCVRWRLAALDARSTTIAHPMRSGSSRSAPAKSGASVPTARSESSLCPTATLVRTPSSPILTAPAPGSASGDQSRRSGVCGRRHARSSPARGQRVPRAHDRSRRCAVGRPRIRCRHTHQHTRRRAVPLVDPLAAVVTRPRSRESAGSRPIGPPRS